VVKIKKGLYDIRTEEEDWDYEEDTDEETETY